MKDFFPFLLFRSFPALVLMSLVAGCSSERGPSIMVEMCLHDEQGVIRFIEAMRQIAASQHMTFIDNSSKAKEELKIVGQEELANRQGAPTIDVSLEGNAGLGVTAGNLGLSPYQVALGFTNGADAAAGLRFSDHVVTTLKKQWSVTKVPDEQGALPSTDCS